MPPGSRPGDADAYAAAYSEYEGFEREMVRLRRAHVLASMRRHPHDHVLEVGCGLEPLFAHYEDRRTHTTVEPAASFHDVAARLAAGRPGVRVLRGTMEQLAPSLKDEPFDFVVASGLLHEVDDAGALLTALHAVCSPSAVAHVNLPNARSFHRLLGVEMGLVASPFETSALGARLHRRRELDEAGLRALVEAAGFRVLRFETYALKPFTHGQMEKLLASGSFPAGLVDGLDRMVRHAPGLGSEMSVEVVRG
jgi:trans-aconitate methyltransferase